MLPQFIILLLVQWEYPFPHQCWLSSISPSYISQYLMGKKWDFDAVLIINGVEHLFICLLAFVFQAHLPDRLHCSLKGRGCVTSFFKNAPQPQPLKTELILFLPKLASPLVLSILSEPSWLFLLSMCPLAITSCYFYLLLNLSCTCPYPYCLAQASLPYPWEKRNHLPGVLVPIFFFHYSPSSWPPLKFFI